MIQDIGAGRYHNEYRPVCPKADSLVTAGESGRILACRTADGLRFFSWDEYCTLAISDTGWRYLFAIDNTAWYLVSGQKLSMHKNAEWVPLSALRQEGDPVFRFAGVTAYQLASWYHSRRICPSCGTPMVHSEKERMMQCPACHLVEYPKICPAVIVGVWHEDRLLLTKYAGRGYHHYALVAGFAEIGESIEDTVRREVMEETGVQVKNLHFYKSQPWSFTDTLLFGFYAELEGSEHIHLDTNELSLARWCTREEIPDDDGISLTREMMRVFKNRDLDIFRA